MSRAQSVAPKIEGGQKVYRVKKGYKARAKGKGGNVGAQDFEPIASPYYDALHESLFMMENKGIGE